VRAAADGTGAADRSGAAGQVPSSAVDEDRRPAEEPEFGPSGYLPERASKRARKIVLRAPLGAQWIVASLVAGGVVLIAGVWFLLSAGAAPEEPWVAVAEVEDVGRALALPDRDVLLVAGAGRIRAFADAGEVAFCADSNRLEAPDGRVWSLTGRGFAGATSLSEHPTMLHEGSVYLDPTTSLPGPEPSDDVVEPGCP